MTDIEINAAIAIATGDASLRDVQALHDGWRAR